MTLEAFLLEHPDIAAIFIRTHGLISSYMVSLGDAGVVRASRTPR